MAAKEQETYAWQKSDAYFLGCIQVVRSRSLVLLTCRNKITPTMIHGRQES